MGCVCIYVNCVCLPAVVPSDYRIAASATTTAPRRLFYASTRRRAQGKGQGQRDRCLRDARCTCVLHVQRSNALQPGLSMCSHEQPAFISLLLEHQRSRQTGSKYNVLTVETHAVCAKTRAVDVRAQTACLFKLAAGASTQQLVQQQIAACYSLKTYCCCIVN